MLPLIGHETLRAKFAAAIARGALPSSLLLYGAAGVGKERLALWIATRLLCETPAADGGPCGTCQHCTYAERGAHPDLHWYFPRPKGKDSDPDVDDVNAGLAEGIAERMSAAGAWERPALTDSLYVSTIRALVLRAALTPAIAKRKVIVVADAERMISQEGADQAANAFLKLLEEPSANTTIIVTSSAPGALLPTIRSRVVSVRVPPLTREAASTLASMGVSGADAERAAATAATAARSLLDAAQRGGTDLYRTAMAQGASGARGAYTATLDALTRLLNERARAAAERGDDAAATGAARGVALVEDTKRLTRQNVNPTLLTARLLVHLGTLGV